MMSELDAADISELAEKYFGASCTLDGKSARIVGRRLPYAIIRQFNGMTDMEVSWEVVDDVMTNKNGEFKTVEN